MRNGSNAFFSGLISLLVAAGEALAGEPQVGTSGNHAGALRADGTVWTWGYNVNGELGDGQAPMPRGYPAQVAGLTDVISIAAATYTGVAVKADGSVWQWGNFSQFLGNSVVPDQITPLADVRAVATMG